MDDVDIALVLAFDGSASVTFEEFNLMAGGSAAALRDDAVLGGLTRGPAGASLCALVLWSGASAHAVLVDWSRIDNRASLDAFCEQVENVPRLVPAGGTAIGEALAFCEAVLARAPARFRKPVVDVVGDGRSNEGTPPGPVRDRLVAAGVTINGLCVLHEEPDLLDSYGREVIGGPSAFALTCHDYSDFADAMRQKLQQEVASSGSGPPPVRRVG